MWVLVDFLVGGGSAFEIVGVETYVLSKSEGSEGKLEWSGLSEGVEKEEEGWFKGLQAPEESDWVSGMLTGVTKVSILVLEAEASTLVKKGSEKSLTSVAKWKIFSWKWTSLETNTVLVDKSITL